MIPPWVVDDLARELNPPAHVLKLGQVRSAENTLAITRALLGNDGHSYAFRGVAVPDSRIPPRYRPADVGTKCNFFVSDVAQIHRAPLPHRWRITPDGKLQWMSANDMATALRGGLYPGWSRIEPAEQPRLARNSRLVQGLPTVATWFNPAKRADGSPASGHIVWVVATPPGKQGIYVTGAGRTCVDQCPISQAFGSHVDEVEFWSHP